MDFSKSNTSMNFDEHVEGVPVLEQLRLQRDSGRFCDVVFHVNHQQYLAHRNVLAACSPYFDSVFDINKSPKEHLSVVCQDNTAFEMIIDYMYTGKITIQRTNATELLKLSHHFMVVKLKEYCCEFLEENITASTCFSIKSNADMCGCPSLSQNCHYYILCNISEVVKQNEVLDFSFAKLEHLLSNKLYTLRQEEKFELILRWTKWDLVEREPFFRTLLSYVNWSSFSLDDLYNSLKSNDIYVNSNSCLSHLLQVLADNGIDLQSHIDVLKHLKAKIQSQKPPDQDSNGKDLSSSALRNEIVHRVNSRKDSQSRIELSPVGPKVTLEGDKKCTVGFIYGKELQDPIGIPLQIDVDLPNFEGSNSDSLSQDSHSPKGSAGSENSVSAEKNIEQNVNKRKLIPTKITEKQKDFPKTTRRKPKPPKRFPFEQYNEEDDDDYEDDNFDTNGRHLDKNLSFLVNNGKVVKEVKASETEKVQDDENTDLPSDPKKRGRRKKERLRCQKCGFLTCTESRLSSHMRSAHKTEDVFACSICDFSCGWNREYYRHMKSHFAGPPFLCDDEACNYTVERIQTLLIHRMRHTGERPYQCTQCDQGFRTKNNLKAHLRSHSGIKPFICEECDRRFATKGTLEQHAVTHSNLRPFLCELCGFSTKYQSHLILHKRIHKGEVFRCQHPNCDYSTPKRSQLGCHMRTHMQVKSHMCNTCGRGFTEKSHLVRHERIHLQEKPFKCNICDYRSTRRDKLKDHHKKHHEKSPKKEPRSTTEVALRRKISDPDMGVSNMEGLPEDMMNAEVDSPLDIDNRDIMQSSVVTSLRTVASSSAMAMLTATGLDTRTFGLLLPTSVTIDSRDEDQDNFRSNLLVEQNNLGDEADNESSSFLEQSPTLQLNTSPVTDFQGSISQAGRTSPEIPGLSSLMSMF